jgi:Protein of unknown function (DUF3306)
MSADESFLTRWSRRKRGAATGEPPPSPTTEDKAGSTAEPAPPIDPASLPPIESIGAGSDIRPFLAPGVPAELTRVALRRAWSADPTIRDFIGLAENSWDFTAPGGVPGFGSVTAEEVERLLARLAGEPAEDEVANPAPGPSSSKPIVVSDNGAHRAVPEGRSDPQAELTTHRPDPLPRRRRHGSALPE